MARRWTAKETALLRSTWKDGKNTDEYLGKLLTRTPAAISNRRSLIGAVKYTKMKNNTIVREDGPLFNSNFSKAMSKALNQPSPTKAFAGCGETIKREITVRETFDMPNVPGGTEAFFKINHCGQVEFQAIGIPPRRVAAILAAIISKIV